MSKLVILVPPAVIARSVYEKSLRELFEAHKEDATIDNVSEFLNAANIDHTVAIGISETGDVLTAFCIDGTNLIAINHG